VAWLREHLPGAPAERRALLKHASRTLIKQGDVQVLRAWGLGAALRGEVRFALSPKRLAVGDALWLELDLRSTSGRVQRLQIDYAVHHVKADGSTSPKVFKGWSVELAAHQRLTLERKHSMRTVTTRRYHAGMHAVDVRINGEVVAEVPFRLGL
jgi:3-methyladenine DNA glycosylase AlkC